MCSVARPSSYRTGPDKASASSRTQRRYSAEIRSNQSFDNFAGFDMPAGTGHTVRDHPSSSLDASKSLPLRQQTLQQAFLRAESSLSTVAVSDAAGAVDSSLLLRSSSIPSRVSSATASVASTPETSRAPSPEVLQPLSDTGGHELSDNDDKGDDVVDAMQNEPLPRLRTRKRALSTVSSTAGIDDYDTATLLAANTVSVAHKTCEFASLTQ
jgi:hypothetical protein